MDSQWQHRKTTVLADLGPLPEVVETDSETLWKMFVELDEQHAASFSRTVPSTVTGLWSDGESQQEALSVQTVMAEARRHNRVCPIEVEWRRLHALLLNAAPDAPAPIVGAELRRTPPLVRRIRVRDQVEWAAERGLLREVLDFIEALPEDHWIHMGE